MRAFDATISESTTLEVVAAFRALLLDVTASEEEAKSENDKKRTYTLVN